MGALAGSCTAAALFAAAVSLPACAFNGPDAVARVTDATGADADALADGAFGLMALDAKPGAASGSAIGERAGGAAQPEDTGGAPPTISTDAANTHG
jgi:hypothetical protein